MKEIKYSDLYDNLSKMLDLAEKQIVMVRAMRARKAEQTKRPNLYLVTQAEMDKLRGSE